MPIIQESSYQSPFWFENGHFQTIIPALFRKVKKVNYTRERLELPDGDFLDLDWSLVKNSKTLAILTHGLEGNSESSYLKGMVKALNNANINALAWNMRSCSGEINRNLRFYHSGATEDLSYLIDLYSDKFDQIYLIGYSLGGNITLNYVGRKGEKLLNSKVKKALTYSVPTHLSTCARNMATFKNKVYLNRFLKSLKSKIVAKNKILPCQLAIEKLEHVKDFVDFDDFYTGPIHGFKDAEDYYQNCSSRFVVDKITIPTLLINAKNDPFLSPECYPFTEANQSKFFYFEAPKAGGHCGFIGKMKGEFWSEKRGIEFLMS